MRKLFIYVVVLMLAALTAGAQAPQKFNYQGVARNSTGSPLGTTTLGLKLSIHDGSSSGTVVYSETQTVTTNAYGLYNLAIGTGTVVTGTFAGINWATGNKYLEVAIDPSGGTSYTTIGTNELLSVPYAMYAGAAPASGVTSVSAGTGLSGGTITGTGTISMPTVGTAGTYGSATQVPVITTDAEGRVTGVTNTTITAGSSGTVTSVTAGTGLSGGTITGTGTISMPGVGTAGTYGSATQVPVFTTDAEGRVTGVTNTTITAGSSGTVTSVSAGTGLSGGTITGSGTISMPGVGTAGTYGSATQVPVITTDAEGRVTSVTNTTITAGGSGTVTSVSAGTGLSGGTITGTGTISMPGVGTAGTYGSATQVPVITTDAEGRVTSVTNTTITAGGTGTVTSVSTSAPLTGGPITSTGTLGLATTGTAGTYGSATQIPVFTTDAWGRVSGVTNTSVTGLVSGGTTDYISKFTSATALGNSQVFDNGTSVGIGTATPSANDKFESINTSTASFTNAIHGISGAAASGVVGSHAGVLGESNTGIGVIGVSSGASGMYGWSTASAYAGVFGTNTAGGYGLWGTVTGTGAAGFLDGGTSGGFGMIVKQGRSGFNTITPSNMAQVEISGVGTYSVAPVYQAGLIVDGTTTSSASGVYAEGGWRGVYGHNLGTSAGVEAEGVLGRQEGSSYTGIGYGVKGENAGTGGTANYGVFGTASGTGNGVGGQATGTGAAGYFDGGTLGGLGVIVKQGRSGFNTLVPTNMAMVEISGVGTYSVAPAYQAGLIVDGPTTLSATGVYAEGGWKGVYGHNLGALAGVEAIGVHGKQEGSAYTGTGYGVKGENTGTGGTANYGVFGTAAGSGNGVGGQATGTGDAGYFDGGASGYGVIVKAGLSGFGTTAPVATAHISGSKDIASGAPTLAGYVLNHQALLAQTSSTATADRANGVIGYAANSSIENDGVDGYVAGTGASYNYGIDGEAVGTTTGNNYGVYSYAHGGATNYGVYGQVVGTGYAGYFSGNVAITGSISKGSGTFKIDHPLDPENKYLSHSFVESPDMMNIYNGNITTDANGDATVTLPDYFEALNKDFRYQLTVIGTFAQAIVSEKVSGNQFKIKTDKPNVEVSWQVTGVRQDKYANAHRVVPEEDKEPQFKGYYLHAKEWGQPASKSIDAKTSPKAAQHLNGQ